MGEKRTHNGIKDSWEKSSREKHRIEKLLSLIPEKGTHALDAGAREGYISLQLTKHFHYVTALDLLKPRIIHPKIKCETGDITALKYSDNSFHTVVCSEVLEHIAPEKLPVACRELIRVSSKYLLIGVPYKQDLRVGRVTCGTCKKPNPAWGHVNSFDEILLKKLFSETTLQKISYAGKNEIRTNSLSVLLMDYAGNPYGDYYQKEACIHCGAKLSTPPSRNLIQKIFTKVAITMNRVQSAFSKPRPFWINFLAKKL